MTTAREDVLARIALAHRNAPPPELDHASIQRSYRTARTLSEDERRELLIERLLDYRALVRRTSSENLAQTVAQALTERGVATLATPADLPPDWLSGIEVRRLRDSVENPLSVGDLDRADGVLTGCALAVAETGTLILDAGAGQGRRALTLVPDYHLCVVLPESVCVDVPQAVRRLEVTRPVTMISGPSATSDIELNRVEGVHGPRTLEVIVVD